MLSAFAYVLLAQAAAQPAKMEIVQARATYGYFGAVRPPKATHPGETLYFAFDVKGMKIDPAGKVYYTILMEVTNEKGENVFRLGPRKSNAQIFLGGDTVPCHAHLDIPVTSPPGLYNLRVTIEDQKTGQKAIFAKQGKLLPANFAIVKVGSFADGGGKTPRSLYGGVGETIYVGFSAVGFARDKESGQPDITMSLNLLDEKGRATMKQPRKGRINAGVDKSATHLEPMSIGFTLNRKGRFTIELQAVDNVSGKRSVVRLPLEVR